MSFLEATDNYFSYVAWLINLDDNFLSNSSFLIISYLIFYKQML